MRSDGRRLVRTHTAKLWDVASGKLIASFEHPYGLDYAAFSPDGARILTAGTDHSAKLWDAASGEIVASFAHKNKIFHAAFSPDGARILTASWDTTVKLWDAASGKLLASFGHQDPTTPAMPATGAPLFLPEMVHAAFSPDGARILTASWDKTAKLWDAATPVELARQIKESGRDTARTGSLGLRGAPYRPRRARVRDDVAPVWRFSILEEH